MDQPMHQKSKFADAEEKMLAIWAKEQTFKNSLDNRRGAPVFSFYDGPPFANGMPHFGHSLVTSIKDSLGRYKTMRGYYVERRNGWDCHGLPVEFAIEKQFGVSGKKQILELGLDKFNAACRDSVFQYKSDWEEFFTRIGRWTDTENAYATIDKDYTESVWWVLKQIHEKGLLYRGFKSMPYCPRCETPLSNFEVNEGYKDNTSDPSLFVKFKLVDEDASLLCWTTTPWSLPGNAAIAVKPDEDYIYVKYVTDDNNEDTIILAKKRVGILDEQNFKIIKEISGSELIGKSYEPLFEINRLGSYDGKENLYKIWGASFVSTDDGTGVLHVAPSFGEDDLKLGIEHNLPVLQTVDNSGHIIGGIGFKEVEGMFFKKADKFIIEYLAKGGMVFAAETILHTYPFCYRCESPLLYYAISTWFISVSSIRDKLQTNAEPINWVPDHIKNGRFGKWLEGARDWAISRNRYWGAPMPIWVNEDDERDYIVVGSIEELKELAGNDINVDDLHRPYIDEVRFTKDGKSYKRLEEVIDCWFESGSMPVAQQHYPFDNEDKFDSLFPADYIGEALDQTRLWFYVLHVISTIIFNRPAYKNVLVNGLVMAADGEKLSKRLKNYPPLDDVFAKEGADTLRLYLLSNYQALNADYMRFNRDAMKDLNRNVLGTLQNSYRFFKMYADIDKWQTPDRLVEPSTQNALDTWMLARLNQTIIETTKQADKYKLAAAVKPVYVLVDDMSNWFIRRSRRRFWKSDDDIDKKQAYGVLHYTMCRICQLLAPWAPFLSDTLWHELVVGTDAPASVHLSDWPIPNEVNTKIIEEMALARSYIIEGLGQRASAKIKVRQPLKSITIKSKQLLSEELSDIVAEELNVKKVVFSSSGEGVVLDTTITDSLKLEGLARDVIRQIQETRKKAGLNVSDRISIELLTTDSFVNRAINENKKEIEAETLVVGGELDSSAPEFLTKIGGIELKIRIQKAR